MAANHNPRPRVACALSAEHVVSARAGDGAQWLEAVSAQSLAPGTATPGLNHANVVGCEGLVAALRDALGAVAGGSRDITR
jgi:hypothetical protein